MAPVAGLDSHTLSRLETDKERTGVLAESLSRQAILDALRARRVFATRDANLRLSYSVNGQPMGSVLANPARLSFAIHVSDPDTHDPNDRIRRIQVVGEMRDGPPRSRMRASRSFEPSHSIDWALDLQPPFDKYYYVRVFTLDPATPEVEGGGFVTAYAAPIWVETD